MKIVGMLGLKGHGKDTAAEALTDKGWLRAAFADPLYAEVSGNFGVSVAALQRRETKEIDWPSLALVNCNDALFKSIMLKLFAHLSAEEVLTTPRSPRFILQHWGTEYRRETFGEAYWREQLKQLLLQKPQANWVITDVRYPDEAQMLQDMPSGQCTLMRVIRPSLMAHIDVAAMHKSEQTMRDYPVDKVVFNHEAKMAEFKADVLQALALT